MMELPKAAETLTSGYGSTYLKIGTAHDYTIAIKPAGPTVPMPVPLIGVRLRFEGPNPGMVAELFGIKSCSARGSKHAATWVGFPVALDGISGFDYWQAIKKHKYIDQIVTTLFEMIKQHNGKVETTKDVACEWITNAYADKVKDVMPQFYEGPILYGSQHSYHVLRHLVNKKSPVYNGEIPADELPDQGGDFDGDDTETED